MLKVSVKQVVRLGMTETFLDRIDVNVNNSESFSTEARFLGETSSLCKVRPWGERVAF